MRIETGTSLCGLWIPRRVLQVIATAYPFLVLALIVSMAYEGWAS